MALPCAGEHILRIMLAICVAPIPLGAIWGWGGEHKRWKYREKTARVLLLKRRTQKLKLKK